MVETLLSPSNVLLYGREMRDITLTRSDEATQPAAPETVPRKGENNFFARQLQAPEARLARIYGFSYEGHYYDLARPAIFLVHGPGTDPEAFRPANALPGARFDRAPADADRTGVAQTGGSFSEDIRVWSYDKGDFSVRLDIETGPLDQILLDCELRPESVDVSYSGASARASGASARLSGASARLSGASARLRNRGGGYGD
jgi:hypothetical protein